MPVDAVGRIPDIIPVVLAETLQHPQLVVEDCHFVILPRGPWCMVEMAFPPHTVGTAPHIVVEFPPGERRGIVGAAAQDPDPVLKDCAAADHAAVGPRGRLRRHPVPVDAVGGVPQIVVEQVFRRRELGNGLPADHPDPALKNDRVMKYPGPPGDGPVPVDPMPCLAVGGIPHVILVMALERIPAHDPHLVVVHGISRGVAPFPVPVRIKGFLPVVVWPLQGPGHAILRTPDLVVAVAGKMDRIELVPASQQPHAILENEGPRAVPRRIRCVQGDGGPGVTIGGRVHQRRLGISISYAHR